MLRILELIFPLYIVIFVGYYFRKAGHYTNEADKFLNYFAYNLLLPATIFLKVAQPQKDTAALNSHIFILYILSLLLISLVGIIILVIRKKQISSNIILVVNMLRGNIIYMGFPLILYGLGEESFAIGGILGALFSPLNIIIATSVILLFNKSEQETTGFTKILKKIIRDPIFLAAVLGVIIGKLHIPLFMLDNTLGLFAKISMPLSLLIIGGNLKLGYFYRMNLDTFFICLGKLVILPLIFIGFSFIFPVEPPLLKVGILLCAMPSGVSNLVLSKQYQLNEKAAVEGIIATTNLSLLTLPLWLYVLENFI